MRAGHRVTDTWPAGIVVATEGGAIRSDRCDDAWSERGESNALHGGGIDRVGRAPMKDSSPVHVRGWQGTMLFAGVIWS